MAIESNCSPLARSHAGASGLWQFMQTTGREYGLEVNKNIDERYHVEKSTVAACKYIKAAYQKYNDWIAEYGDYAESYIGAEYKAKITLYKQQYNTLKSKADSLIDDIDYLFELMDEISFEAFDDDCLEIEEEYLNIKEDYKKFKEDNGGHADVITNYDIIESTFERKKYEAYLEYYIGSLESTVNKHISGMNTSAKYNIYRTQLRSLLSTAISALEDIYEPAKNFDKNKTELLLEYNTHNDAIAAKYQEYKVALAVG
jgi:hypothetical protein